MQTIFSQEFNSEKRLILQVDVNKTIIAMDLVQNKGIEETINGILAEYTFYKWNGNDEQSYYAYLTDKIAQENPQLSRTNKEFKSKRASLLLGFPDYLKNYPHLLATYEEEKGSTLKILSADEMVIFPSFFNLITWLNQHFKNKYVLYLRTFGEDLAEVISLIEKKSELRFYE